ncbi:MAG: caspase family protein, partial [Candidatus Solibacter sp.]|nr:caspase family protein [Candidatus Solibacter sp.]
MAERRFGVLIASSRFPADSGMLPLRCPDNDADGLFDILTGSGDFLAEDVHVLKNALHYEALRQVNQVLRAAGKDDLVLLYYSGHGKQDDNGRLHLATVDTLVDALESTSIPIEQIRSMI